MILMASTAMQPLFHHIFGFFCLAISVVCVTRGRLQRFFGSMVAASVFAVTAWYLCIEVSGGRLISGSRASPSILNAILAFTTFGVPAAIYLFSARFGFGVSNPVEDLSESDHAA